MVGGTTENPAPYAFERVSSRAYRVCGTAAEATIAPVAGAGVVLDAGGTTDAPAGTTPGSGGFDAAVLRLAP